MELFVYREVNSIYFYIIYVSPSIVTDIDTIPTASLYLDMEKRETQSKNDVSSHQSLSCSPPAVFVLSLRIVVHGVQNSELQCVHGK